MRTTVQTDALQRELETAYTTRTPGSAARIARAARVMPDGDTRHSAYFRPYPLFLRGGAGARVEDVDGNAYLDFSNNYTSLVHGHAFPDVVRAATEQIAHGSAWAAANERALELAELIIERVPSIERVRFCNSGTEATMLALRAARAFTGRNGLIKMAGGYHGSHDDFQVSGGRAAPGIPPEVAERVVEIPFNDKHAASEAIDRHGHEAAAVIVEGIMGSAGMVPPEDGYLQHLRAETERHGMLLIVDEVITLRLAEGGAQQLFEVRPDLTAMGKIVGGGFPVGAFGGREEVMQQFSPLRAGGLGHSGTFNGNPVTMAAGLATLRALPQSAIDRINALGDRFAEGVRDAAAERGIRLQVTGVGSLRNLQFSAERVYDNATAAAADKELIRLLHLALLERGIFAAPRGMFAISTPMGESEVDEAVAAVDEALRRLLPAIEERAPALLS